jgi:hypothetical protein
MDFVMPEIWTALASLGNHGLAFFSQMGLTKEMLPFPSVQHWITPSAVLTMVGFALILIAILAFAGVATMNTRSRTLLIGGYVLAALLLLIGRLQAARQEQAVAETQKLSAIIANPTRPVQPDITMRLLDEKGPTIQTPQSTTIPRHPHPRLKYWGD